MDCQYSLMHISPAPVSCILFRVYFDCARKDVRNAVECAVKAQPGWDKRSGFNRSQILFYLAENLDQRRDEFVAHLVALTG